MVKITKVFEPESVKNNSLFLKAVKEVSSKIGEPTSTSSFITLQDALHSKTDIFLIEEDAPKKSPSRIQRDFIPA